MCEELMRRRRDFIKLVFAGALSGATSTLADALGAAKAAPAAAGPPPVPFADGSVLALARQLAKSPFKAAQRRAARSFRQSDLRTICRHSRQARLGAVERRQCRLRPGAAASRLHFFDADGYQHRRERHGAKGPLRPRRIRLRQAATARRFARHRLFRLSRPGGGGGPGLSGSGDLSGRELFSRQGARAEPRRHGARPVDSHRRTARRGISAVSRGLDRKAEAGHQRPGHPRAARLGERHRRVPLHPAPRRGDDHRYRTDDRRAGRRSTMSVSAR